MNHFLLTRFVQMNDHLKIADPMIERIKKLVALSPDLFTARQELQCQRLASQLIKKFGSGFEGMDQKIPRFIVVDEHNELFRPSRDGTIPADDPQLQHFARGGWEAWLSCAARRIQSSFHECLVERATRLSSCRRSRKKTQ